LGILWLIWWTVSFYSYITLFL